MKLACNLKLKSGTAHEQIITEILTNLNLNHRRKSRATHLSGGERRRLSIALELVANPAIFFLDEPTSGLDEVTAAQCIRLLKNLAKQERTIVCTIHQPSATTFALFDQIFVLARGKCVYQGSPAALVPFLSSLNLPCPTHYSPSDYIIELCDADEGSIVDVMAHQTSNGKLICAMIETTVSAAPVTLISATIPAITATTATTATTTMPAATVPAILEGSDAYGSYIMKNAITSMFLEKPKASNALLQKMKAFSRLIQSDYATSGFRQFYVLLNVMMVKICRNRSVLAIQLFHHVLCGVMFGKYLFVLLSS